MEVNADIWVGPRGGARAYLSGPMTGLPEYNRPAFAAAAEELRARGLRVFDPGASHTDLPDGHTTHQQYMVRDLPVVMASDRVLVLDGWENSAGARLEVHTALVCDIPVNRVDNDEPVTALPHPPSASTPEWRVTDPTTGGQKGAKPARMGLMPPDALLRVAEVFHHGSRKYADHNWSLGYAWSLSYDAMLRHLLAFWGGEDTDPESGMPHVAHAAWHALVLTAFLEREAGTDDRPHVVLAQMRAEREP